MALKLFRAGGSDAATFGGSSDNSGMSPRKLALWTTLWLATLGNIALWQTMAGLPETGNFRGLLFGIGMGIGIAAAIHALLCLLTWRWVIKPVAVLLVMVAALSTHYMLTYNIVIDPTMLSNVFNTDPREVRDLLSWRLLLTLGGLGLLPCLWLLRQSVGGPGWLRQALNNLVSFIISVVVMLAAVLIIFQDFSSTMRNHPQVRYLINPLNTVWGLTSLASGAGQRMGKEVTPIGLDARLGASYAAQTKPPLVLLVIGETARSGNFALNGYDRPTNPALSREDIASFRNVWSCGTNTAASVPCMFSHLGREDFVNRKANAENLMDVLQHAGLAVLWVDNQSGCSGPCVRIPTVNTSTLKDPRLCPASECFDEIMLQDIDERIAALPAERRARGVVLVMHQMGSHGPAYYKRVPAAFKTFQPECSSNALQDCDRQQVVNAYDNTIVYTDHFLASAIAWLKKREKDATTAMLYLADHGESLGENNLYLHGLPYSIAPDVQKQVPWISWMSPDFERRTGVTTACLKQHRDMRASHDNFFHTVLGMVDVQTSVYQQSLDLYKMCASAGKP